MANLNGVSGLNFNPVRQDPDSYAKSYAEKNGLSFDEAKAELKSKFGDPQQQQTQGFGGNYDTSIFSPNFGQSNSSMIKQDPDEYAQIYADENGITLAEAKAELKAKYGDPTEPSNNMDYSA